MLQVGWWFNLLPVEQVGRLHRLHLVASAPWQLDVGLSNALVYSLAWLDIATLWGTCHLLYLVICCFNIGVKRRRLSIQGLGHHVEVLHGFELVCYWLLLAHHACWLGNWLTLPVLGLWLCSLLLGKGLSNVPLRANLPWLRLLLDPWGLLCEEERMFVVLLLETHSRVEGGSWFSCLF